MRVLTGIQPSGKIHIGNYFGAMKQLVELQKGNTCFYMVANLHALTTTHDKKFLEETTLNLAMDYLAFGVNPTTSTLFIQSEVPAHTEGTWIMATLCSMGLLERAHAWKDAKAKKMKDPSVGLFIYPVLMALDILLYEPDIVPVGQDQKQHIEIARDLATKFNSTYGETFKLPEAVIKKDVAIVPGTDGQKMSKSYGNTIDIFASEEELRKSVMGIVTDSTPINEPKDPNKCNVFALYKLLANPSELKEMSNKYKSGGFGYGEAKKELLQKILEYFDPFRQKRFDLNNKIDYVRDVLEEGNKKARKQANIVLDKMKFRVGLKV